MSKENKPNGDLEDIRSQADDLLKSLDSVDTPSESSPKSASTKGARESPPAKPTAQKSSSSSSKTVLVAAGSLAGLAVVIIGGLIGLEFSKQATLNLKTEIAAREQAAREQVAREQEAREQAAREQAAREQEAREQAAREQEAREQKEAERLSGLRRELVAKGWNEVGSSGLLFRYCNPGANNSSLGNECSEPSGQFDFWFGVELYCLNTICRGVVEGSFGDEYRNVLQIDTHSYASLTSGEKRIFLFARTKGSSLAKVWLSKAAGFCDGKERRWRKC